METNGTGTEKRIEDLKAIGGSLWEKAGMSRVYFGGLTGLYGLSTNRYNSGRISSATLNGETISNNQAVKIIDRLADAKLWWDVNAGAWASRNMDTADQDVLVAEIERRVANL